MSRSSRYRYFASATLVACTLALVLIAPVASDAEARAAAQAVPAALPPGVSGLTQASITGQIDVVLLRFDYPDARYSQSNEQQEALWDAAFDHLDWYYQRQSNGKISEVTVSYPGYFDLGTPHSEITGLFDIRTKARDKATELFDLDLSAFDVAVYAMPGGLSIPGANGGGFGNTGNIWLPQTSEAGIREGLVHEMGHAFSMGHSAASTSTAGAVLPSGTAEGGSDPYGMMGSGQNSFKADWPLNMRHSRGWIDDDQWVDCSANGTVRIYSSFAERIPAGRTVGCRTILRDGSQGDRPEDVWFSYAPSDEAAASFEERFGIDLSHNLTGLMMHSVIGSSEPVMIDLTPGSQASDFRLPIYVDTMDGTLRPNETVTVDDGDRGELTITNVGTGGSGDDRWIDVEFDWADGGPPPTATATPIPEGDPFVVVDGFDGGADAPLDGVGGGRGFIENWRVTNNGNVATITDTSLAYAGIVESGNALSIEHVGEASGNSFLAERTLQQPITTGEAWMSYRVRASAVGAGHFFVAPTRSGDSGIGKAWGSSFSIHNDRSAVTFGENQTYLLVARYELDSEGPDRIDLWIDPDPSVEPTLATVAVTKEAEIGTIDALRLNVQDYGNGRYELDEFRLGASWAQMVRDPANPLGTPTPTPLPVPSPTPTPSPGQSVDATHTLSCLAGNGRLDTMIVNRGANVATYRLEFAGLSARQVVVDPGDWARMPITGRPDGPHLVTMLRDGVEISQQTFDVSCDSAPPVTPGDEVTILNACRDGFGYVLFQFLNGADTSAGYVISFDGVPNRSTSAAAYGQAIRAVTGRPTGDYEATIHRNGQPLLSATVEVSC